MLANAERVRATNPALTHALPDWIAGCARRLDEPPGKAEVAGAFPRGECGLLVQFIYDAAARARSNGSETLHDIWRPLLNASYRRGESGASVGDFLASSKDARRIALGLMEGAVDWDELVTMLEGIGVRISLGSGPGTRSASVLELKHFRD